jgi:hypothetical protein
VFQDGVKKTISSTSVKRMGCRQGNSPRAIPTNQPSLTTARHSAHSASNRRSMTQLHWFPSLPFQQFQVLFNSLFKVLCIFPSRYLYAIGLPPIFSFRWNLPPTLSCNPKQLDSLTSAQRPGGRESHPLCCPVPRDLARPITRESTDHNSAQSADSHVSYSRFSRPY